MKLKCFAWLTLLSWTLRVGGAEVHLFAASSLTDTLKKIAADYGRNSGDKIVFNFGASSLLARQIEEGAPADIFFSADELKMDNLAKQGLLLNETRKSKLSNTLAIVVASDSSLKITSPEDLAGTSVRHLALADPKAVPAGIYAKEFLVKRKLWTAVEPKVIPTENVRAALAAVESGNAEAGIVYQTDAVISKNVKVAFQISRTEGPSISYPIAVIKGGRNVEGAKKVLEYFDSPAVGQIFRAYGFIVLE
jgi:molybdate transport system substrate-binding protein